MYECYSFTVEKQSIIWTPFTYKLNTSFNFPTYVDELVWSMPMSSLILLSLEVTYKHDYDISANTNAAAHSPADADTTAD